MRKRFERRRPLGAELQDSIGVQLNGAGGWNCEASPARNGKIVNPERASSQSLVR